MSLPLPYVRIKDFYNGEGYPINPFFGRWKTITELSGIELFVGILNTVTNERYNHPNITANCVTRPAPYFTKDGDDETQIDFNQMMALLVKKGYEFVAADTMDGRYLIVVGEGASKDTASLSAAAYKTYAINRAAALREVDDTDRQVHWVWFRKSPTWRLTSEIVLRAASWIELNPGFTFHLWTNLRDATELADFLGSLEVELRERYFTSGRIIVHYEEDFRENLFGWFTEHMPHLYDLFQTVWFSQERQDIVMKTDYARNILLAIHGGLYADFNDLVCVSPIEPLLEAHAGNFFGVTDNTSTENASNYLLYAGADNKEWLSIVKRCTETIQRVYSIVHSAAAEEYAKEVINKMVSGRKHSLDKLDTVFPGDFATLYKPNHFIHAIIVAIHKTLGIETSNVAKKLYDVDMRSMFGRYKPSFVGDCVDIIEQAEQEIMDCIRTDEFGINWRFAVAHIYLRAIMYCSNLPIFCRQQKIPIYLVPYSYLLRYSCLLSFVGHIGDGTSYGGEVTKSVTMRGLLGYE
jgi:hypothetical protein